MSLVADPSSAPSCSLILSLLLFRFFLSLFWRKMAVALPAAPPRVEEHLLAALCGELTKAVLRSPYYDDMVSAAAGPPESPEEDKGPDDENGRSRSDGGHNDGGSLQLFYAFLAAYFERLKDVQAQRAANAIPKGVAIAFIRRKVLPCYARQLESQISVALEGRIAKGGNGGGADESSTLFARTMSSAREAAAGCDMRPTAAASLRAWGEALDCVRGEGGVAWGGSVGDPRRQAVVADESAGGSWLHRGGGGAAQMSDGFLALLNTVTHQAVHESQRTLSADIGKALESEMFDRKRQQQQSDDGDGEVGAEAAKGAHHLTSTIPSVSVPPPQLAVFPEVFELAKLMSRCVERSEGSRATAMCERESHHSAAPLRPGVMPHPSLCPLLESLPALRYGFTSSLMAASSSSSFSVEGAGGGGMPLVVVVETPPSNVNSNRGRVPFGHAGLTYVAAALVSLVPAADLWQLVSIILEAVEGYGRGTETTLATAVGAEFVVAGIARAWAAIDQSNRPALEALVDGCCEYYVTRVVAAAHSEAGDDGPRHAKAELVAPPSLRWFLSNHSRGLAAALSTSVPQPPADATTSTTQGRDLLCDVASVPGRDDSNAVGVSEAPRGSTTPAQPPHHFAPPSFLPTTPSACPEGPRIVAYDATDVPSALHGPSHPQQSDDDDDDDDEELRQLRQQNAADRQRILSGLT